MEEKRSQEEEDSIVHCFMAENNRKENMKKPISTEVMSWRKHARLYKKREEKEKNVFIMNKN